MNIVYFESSGSRWHFHLYIAYMYVIMEYSYINTHFLSLILNDT